MKYKIFVAIAVLFTLMANPRQLFDAVQAAPTETSWTDRLKSRVYGIFGDNRAITGGILAGILLMIIGFATLLVGNYIVYAIVVSLPALNSTDYNNTRASIIGYVNTVMPLFGLVLMIFGFALILWTLRTSLGEVR